MKKQLTKSNVVSETNWMKSLGINFILAGAMRSGSTYLFELLRHHPQINMPARKELHYFSKESQPQLEEYREFFRDCDPEMVIGEASPEYMFFPYCAQRIKDHLPAIKLIFILRNPVKRAFSHYLWATKGGKFEYLTFENALAAEEDRLKSLDFNTQNAFSYRVRGEYLRLLQPYLNLFPKENIKVILFEDLKEKGQKVYDDLCDFLDIDRISLPEIERHNHAIIPRFLPVFRQLTYIRRHMNWGIKGGSFFNRILRKLIRAWPRTGDHPKISPHSELLLKKHYKSHNLALFDFLNRENIWD